MFAQLNSFSHRLDTAIGWIHQVFALHQHTVVKRANNLNKYDVLIYGNIGLYWQMSMMYPSQDVSIARCLHRKMYP